MASIAFTNSMERALQTLFQEVSGDIISRVCEHFKLDVEEATRVSGISDITVTKKVAVVKAKKDPKPKAPKKELPAFVLPFVGKVDEDLCHGIKLNNRLHTQCTKTRNGSTDYCKTCGKQAEENATHKPNYGDIRDRLDCPLLEFKDYKGVQTLPYANVMKKLDLTREKVEAEAAKFGITIPEEHFVLREVTRGRKKKDTDSDVSSTDSSEKKARGRPAKTKPVVTEGDSDLLAQLEAAEKSSVSSGSKPKRAKLTEEEKEKRNEERKAKTAAKNAAKKLAKAEEAAAAKLAELKKQALELSEKAESIMSESETSTDKAEVVADDADVTGHDGDEAKFAGCAAGVEAAIKEDKKQKVSTKKAVAKKVDVPKEDDDIETEDEDDDELKEEETTVKKITIKGKAYLMDNDNTLFDIKTHDCVGIYDEDNDEIETIDTPDSDNDE